MNEIWEIENKYNDGQLESIYNDLKAFVHDNAECINNFKTEYVDKIMKNKSSNEIAIKLFILQTRTIHPENEILDELQEIETEVWIRAEKTDNKIKKEDVVKEWCKKHAPGWRDHRVMAIVYVFEQNKEELLKIYLNALDNL